MPEDFAKQINEIFNRWDDRLEITVKMSVQRVISLAQKPYKGGGGNMPIDTGFLRASLQAGLNGLPSGPTVGERKEKNSYPAGVQVDGEPVAVVLLKWRPEDNKQFFAGWTANYARWMEYEFGFLRSAAQQWKKIVAEEAKKAQTLT